MGIESEVLGLLIISVFVAATARRFRIPHTVAMVLTGLGVGLLNLRPEITDIQLEPHLILVTFLPGLLFEAAYHIDLRQLRENIRTILLLAIPGVLLSTAIIGFLLNQFLPLSLAEAMLFGIIISATDPVAVVAIFKELGVNKRLRIIVEGESLFNDGAAIVLYSILLGVATGDEAFSLSASLTEFFVSVAGGIALGLVMGLIFSELMKRTEEHVLDIALTAILAYGTYLIGENLLQGAVSPVIAVVVAAIYVGNYGSAGSYSATSQVTIISFWEFVAFLLNSAIFLLIGLEIEPVALVQNIVPVLIGIGSILLARFVVVFVLRGVVNRGLPKLPMEWGYVLFWGGLRGAVSIALALSLPFRLESRPLMELLVFGYVLFSLVAQALTIKPLISRLGIIKVGEKRREFENYRAELAMSQAALQALEDLRESQVLSGPICDNLQKIIEDRMDTHWREMNQLIAEEPTLVETDVRMVQREIALRQKQALLRLVRRGILSESIYDELLAEIDERQMRMAQEDWSPPSLLVRGVDAYLPTGTGSPFDLHVPPTKDDTIHDSSRDV